MRLVNIEPCKKLGHAMVLYATEGGMLVQIRSCDMPTIDAVPVVRCKDCVSGPQRADVRIFHCNVLGCGGMKPNDFCSYGEKRKEGDGK